MKKVLGYILSVIGFLGFLSLYVLMVVFKDSDIIGYVIMSTGFVSIILFIVGVMLINKPKQNNKE